MNCVQDGIFLAALSGHIGIGFSVSEVCLHSTIYGLLRIELYRMRGIMPNQARRKLHIIAITNLFAQTAPTRRLRGKQIAVIIEEQDHENHIFGNLGRRRISCMPI